MGFSLLQNLLGFIIIHTSPFSDSFDVPPSSSADSLSVATSTSAADDPPLENLMRDERGSVTSLQSGPEADLLSSLLGSGAADSPLAGLMGAQSQNGGEF